MLEEEEAEKGSSEGIHVCKASSMPNLPSPWLGGSHEQAQLQICRKSKNLAYAKRLHAHLCDNGLESHRAVGNYIVPMFVECGSLQDAQQVFNNLVYRNVHSWTSLILGYIQRGESQHAINLYQKMQEDNVHPSSYTLMALLKASARLRDVERGRQIHVEIAHKSFESNVFVGSTLIDMYAKCGSLLEARQVFDKLSVRNVVSWNALIAGYAEHGPGLEALKCFEHMKLEDISPDAATFVSLLKACGSIGAIERGQEVHAEIIQGRHERDAFVCNSLVNMYARCGSFAEAQEVFDNLPLQDVVAWTALIAGYAEHGCGQEAIECFEKMQLELVSPDAVTFVCVLKACGCIGDINKGREIHSSITQHGFEGEAFVSNALVDMYAKCGSLAEAQEVFDNLHVRNVLSWNALIAGYAEHRYYQEALKCFEEMQWEGVISDSATFVCILQVCGSLGAINKGRHIHADVTEKGIEKDVRVSSTLIDMYSKCGSFADAQEVFDELPVRNAISWNALIAGHVECGSPEALKCFEQMQLEGVFPDAVTFVYTLKLCGSMGAVDKGRDMHVYITQKGLERDVFAGSTLVDMYAKCGSLAEAQEVFDKMPTQNVVSWTALIAGYAEHGPLHEVLKCCEQMQLEGISPDAVTFVFLLKACGSVGAIKKVQQIHSDIIRKGFDRDVFVGSALVETYSKCGSPAEAWKIFDKLLDRNIASWNALVAGFTEYGPYQEVMKCFERMQLEDFSPDAVTCVCVLKACGNIGAIEKGQEVHVYIAQQGLERDFLVSSTLVDMYAKCGALIEARKVFDKLSVQDILSWNALISGYSIHGTGEEALKCFEQLQLEGITPDTVTFVCLLKACGIRGAIDKGREIHTNVAQRGFERDVVVGSTLVDMYSKCGLLLEAQEVFDKLQTQSVVSWNALIAGYAEHGSVREVTKCLEWMQLEGIFPNALTFVAILKACGSVGAIDKGREMHIEIAEEGFERDVFVGSALVDMYAKCGSLVEAQEVFDKLPFRNVVSWNALIAGYVEHGPYQKALKCFEQMRLDCVSPDAVTFVCILKACAITGAVYKGRNVHVEIICKGFEKDLSIGNALVLMYAKCGLLLEAHKVFDKLPVRDVVSWNALIKGYGLNHQGNLAVQCFEDMQEQGVMPDDIIFTCLLTACSRARLVVKGQEFFKLMREEYGIVPTLVHYTCMVDLLAKSGHLYEAEKFLQAMPCPSVWTALLSACKTHGEAEMGLRCFRELIQMNRGSASPYVLMANIYASAGRCDDACRIEELRKYAGAKKKPASALIEVQNKVHEFVVGNNQSNEISAMLEILNSRMKEEGHVPRS